MNLLRCVALMGFAVFASGCGQRGAPAPVEELSWRPWSVNQTTHTVHRGETLYAIAFRYEKDYHALARLNGLRPPFALHPGQVLRLNVPRVAPRGVSTTYRPSTRPSVQRRPSPVPPARASSAARQTPAVRMPVMGGGSWIWPAQGRLAATYAPEAGRKGIDIAGKKGDRIVAASSGVVAYSGSGLAGYGNLVIIRHNNQFLTAYANNARNLVKEGQNIKAGQIIAEMGVMDRRYWGVHFEIRRYGQPVNPLGYLRRLPASG